MPQHTRSDPPPLDLNTLPQRSLGELRTLWRAHLGRAKPPSQRRMLIRELAWRIQARQHGGLDAHTQRLLKAAMRDGLRDLAARRSTTRATLEGSDLNRETLGADSSASHLADERIRPRRRVAVQPIANLPPGTRLLRLWNGRRHEVIMRDRGRCTYQGKEFGSLSEVAREITATRWSGPRFFGVTIRATPYSSPSLDDCTTDTHTRRTSVNRSPTRGSDAMRTRSPRGDA